VAQARPLKVTAEAEAHQQGPQLYDQGIWFPDIPPNHVRLNQASFPQLELYTTTYRPLCWVSFGGVAGIYLQHLTKITMTVFGNAIYGIQFHYNDSTRTDELGRHSYHMPEYADYADTQELSIDGPTGERIESLTAVLTYSTNPESMPHLLYGSLNHLKVSYLLSFHPQE
jgi:hypothetical protein